MQIFCQQSLAHHPLPAGVDLLLVAVAGDKAPTARAWSHTGLAAKAQAQLLQAVKSQAFAGRTDEQLVTQVVGEDGKLLTVALLGMGEAMRRPQGTAWIRLGGRAVRLAMARRALQPLLAVPDAPVVSQADEHGAAADNASKRGEQASLQQALWLAQGLRLGAYENLAYRSEPQVVDAQAKPRASVPRRFGLAIAGGAAVGEAVDVGQTLANSITLARDLVNMPANELGPPEFAARVRSLCKERKLRCKVLDEKALEAEGMQLLLSVGRGSARPPALVHVAYEGEGAEDSESVALVGKGITFDSGGYCIKPCEGMATMKMDMGGAAAVLGTVLAAHALGLPVRLHAVLALAENMVSGVATRPGDIFKSAAGITVEINNTDAEGRLVLADAITWTRRHLQPDLLVDVATLTGACMVALGPKTIGLFSNQDSFAKALKGAAADAGEDIWRMPLTPSLRDQLKSDVADMRNTGERYGGAITAGLFLQRFVGEVPWAHLDIAGPAWATEEAPHQRRGGTGVGCATLVRWLMRLASGERVMAASPGRKASPARSRRPAAAPPSAAPTATATASRQRRRGPRDR